MIQTTRDIFLIQKLYVNLKYIFDKNYTKIFQIGFNKCGTNSIAHFFQTNNYKVAHWDKGVLALKIHKAKMENNPLLTYIVNRNVLTDMEAVPVTHGVTQPKFKNITIQDEPIYAFKYYKEFLSQYPNSRFILNTRPFDSWIKSRLKHGKGKYLRTCSCGFKKHESRKTLIECWEKEWNAHHMDVKNFFADKPGKLLKFNIQTDPPKVLADFFSLDVTKWTHLNQTKNHY